MSSLVEHKLHANHTGNPTDEEATTSIESPAQSPWANEWQNEGADPGLFNSQPILLTYAIAPYCRLIFIWLVVDFLVHACLCLSVSVLIMTQ